MVSTILLFSPYFESRAASRGSSLSSAMTAKSRAFLPTASSPDYRNLDAASGHAQQPPRRPNLKKLAVGASLALATIGLLYKPAFSHYQRIYQHSCSKALTVEERAHKILSTTPLIGTLVQPFHSISYPALG